MRVYAFEDISIDLARQPLAALRALRAVGVALSPQGWSALSASSRFHLCQLGTSQSFDEDAVQEALRGLDMRRVRMVTRVAANPEPAAATQHLLASLKAPPELWARVDALDRWVLRALSEGLNSRLFQRAYAEIVRRNGVQTRMPDVTAPIARCELALSGAARAVVASPYLEGGRAVVLARASGLRAARAAPTVLDALAEEELGPIELGATMWRDRVLWQAHASSVEGAFIGAASLIAVTAAAVALLEMVSRAETPLFGGIALAEVREDVWVVGGDDEEELTRMHRR